MAEDEEASPHPALGPFSACSLHCTEMPPAASCSGALVKGCREGLSLHVSDPGRCVSSSMASHNHVCVLPLDLFLRAVPLGTCGFTQQL